jgi:hypothetical protein
MSDELCMEREPPGELRPIVTAKFSGTQRSEATSPLSAKAQLVT